MQNPQPSVSARFLVLSPAGMAVALAALAFLRGLFGFAFGFVHHRMAPMGGPGMGPGMGGAMQPHHFAHSSVRVPIALASRHYHRRARRRAVRGDL